MKLKSALEIILKSAGLVLLWIMCAGLSALAIFTLFWMFSWSLYAVVVVILVIYAKIIYDNRRMPNQQEMDAAMKYIQEHKEDKQ